MKLKNVKISNLMSFPYIEDFDTFEGVSFSGDKQVDLNILIGGNGSGKSNFIDIINQFVKTLIFDYVFDVSILQEKEESLYKQAIQLLEKKTFKMRKSSNDENLSAYLELEIELFETDFENIAFVCKNVDRINAIIDKYSNVFYRFPKFKLEDLKRNKNTIKIRAEFLEKEQRFIVNPEQFVPEDHFILSCFQEQELLYICTRIFNEFDCVKGEKIGYPLRWMFSILGSNRDQIDWKYLYSGRSFDNYIFSEKDKKNQILEGFYKVLYKVWLIIHGSVENMFYEAEDELEMLVETRLLQASYRQRLTKTIYRFIGKNLVVEIVQGELFLKLQTKHGESLYFSDLSAGQQSILVILFAIFGSDLRNGVMIIDEPELHVHPQLQKELALLLNQWSLEKNTQFIISTYSSLFINEDNITNVYRFQKEHTENFDGTRVYNPDLHMASDDAKLVHLLRFENLSKIFFVAKIILVEGDSDLYFFSHYLKWLQEQPGWEDIIGTYELININGKGSYKVWKRFLDKFGIECFFIGDWDNTIDYGFFSTKEINKYYSLANKNMRHHQKSGDTIDYYNKLVFVIKKFYPHKYQQVLTNIERLYKDNVFVLKQGAIESYPGLERKGLQFMVHFANYEFENWLLDRKFSSQREEILTIFKHIFGKN